MKKIYPKILILVLLALASCNIPPKGQFERENGVILDTLNNRNMYYKIYSTQIETEAMGIYPERNWIKSWESKIGALRSGNVENPEPIVNYIITERRKRGLPELDL